MQVSAAAHGQRVYRVRGILNDLSVLFAALLERSNIGSRRADGRRGGRYSGDRLAFAFRGGVRDQRIRASGKYRQYDGPT